MKLKITDVRIPGIILLIGSLGALIGIFAPTENVSTIGGITLAVAMILLVLVYFPILTIALLGNKIENKEKIVTNIGLFSLSFIIISLFLRLYHLPGAGPIIVVGCVTFALNFLPSWYASKFRQTNWYQRILNLVFCTTLGLLVLAHQFKTMHWPGATVLQNSAYNLGIFILIPFGLFTLLFKRKENYFSFNLIFIFGFTIAYIISGTVSSKLANSRFASDNKTQRQIENNLRLYEAKNKYLYETLEKGNMQDSSYLSVMKKVKDLKNLSQNIFNYIYKSKTDLILIVDELPESARDSITFDNIQNKINADHTTYIFVGEDEKHPRTDAGSAIELKQKIEQYIVELNNIVPEEYKLQLKQSNPFDFSDIELEDNGGKEKWEVMTFFHEPAATVFTTLSGFQANVRYMEMAALNALFTKANSGKNNDLAAELAELSLKYETEKQDKKISILQKDQEMVEVKMQAKDAEISSREGTITLFIFGAIIFGILMIFVIRSNILRKQTNKELAEQKDIITAQKNEVESQKHLVEEKQKEIVDSITYAKRLQEAILPAQEIVNNYLPENFILYTPKDLVAGDFYWMEVVNDGDKEITFIAAADSTGHGVPGAMVSVVCSNALNRAVLEFKLTTTGQILDKTRELVLDTFSKSTTDVKDGMDISLLAVIRQNNEIIEINWSGANNPLWFISSSNENQNQTEPVEVKEVKANKQPIGKTDNPTPFTTHSIPYVKGTSFYLFTDGYADQFGGPKGKKFKYKQLEELLLELSTKEMSIQKETLNSKFEEWKSGIEQVDDVCVIGVKL